TLRTTRVPSCRAARCTWATEALASGSCSIEANASCGDRPRLSARAASMTGQGSGFACVCRRESSRTYGSESRSPCGEHLPELHERHTRLVEGLAQGAGRLVLACLVVPAVQPAGLGEQAVPHGDAHDLEVAGAMGTA